jgi:Acetyltransferases, including N-acetylases of ribosomal proteins
MDSRPIPLEIETPRLVLRCPRPGDGATVHGSVVESLAQLRRFGASLPWALEEPKVEISEAYAQQAEEKFLAREEFRFLVFTRDGAHVGNCGIHDIDWKVPKCEIGWWGRSTMLGRGLMSEAARAMLAFCFDTLRMRRVAAKPDVDNERSCALCERIGLQLEGTLRNARIEPDGRLKDVRVYAAIR